MEEEKQKAEVKMGVDLDLNGNEILDITFDRGDYLQPFGESYQQLDFFSVEELIKGYNTKPIGPERELVMTFENNDYEEEPAMAVPYELRTIETEFQKVGYTTEEHEEFGREMETSLKKSEEEEDGNKGEKELELEDISAEVISEEKKIKVMAKEEKVMQSKVPEEENDQEQNESPKLLSDKRLHQLLLELIHL